MEQIFIVHIVIKAIPTACPITNMSNVLTYAVLITYAHILRGYVVTTIHLICGLGRGWHQA